MYDAIHENESYKRNRRATDPHPSIRRRPDEVVPISSLGHRYGVRTRGLQSIIHLTSIMHGTDYWRRGRTLRKLGIDRLSVGELTTYVTDGILSDEGDITPVWHPPTNSRSSSSAGHVYQAGNMLNPDPAEIVYEEN